MKISKGKIVECTEYELYQYWLDRYDDIYDFETYKRKCIENGTEVIANSKNLPQDKP